MNFRLISSICLITALVSNAAAPFCFGQLFRGGGIFRSRGNIRYTAPTKSVLSYNQTHSQCRQVQADTLCHKKLGSLIDEVLKKYSQKKETVFDRSPWGVMHAVLAWGNEAKIWQGNQPLNAVDLLCENYRLKSVHAFRVQNKNLVPAEGPGLQGHPGQLLAVLAQTDLPKDYKLKANGTEFSIEDLIRFEQLDCKKNQELTFKLIGLLHYLPLDATWKNSQGEDWSLTKLVEIELGQPINGASCGGSHRLMALAMAAEKVEKIAKEEKETWQKAKEYIEQYHEYTFHLFNDDGSFSTDWFKSRQTKHDPQLTLQTTGHVAEWLVTTLPEERLDDPKIKKSIYFLCRLMINNPDKTWSIGPRAHAIRALRIYRDRFVKKQIENEKLIAKKSQEEDEKPKTDKSKPQTDSVKKKTKKARPQPS